MILPYPRARDLQRLGTGPRTDPLASLYASGRCRIQEPDRLRGERPLQTGLESKVSTFKDQVNHAFKTIGAFPVAAPVVRSWEGDQEYTITTNAGFSCRRPYVCAAMAIFMLR